MYSDHSITIPRKMGHKEIASLLEGDLRAVETSIMKNFRSDVAMIPVISGYLTNGGGKRIRPMLVLLTSNLCGYGGGDAGITHSTVVEYIHAATLLHDDVVDSADERRGIPSANAKWGNGYAVLVGDFLFAKSFSLMADASQPEIIRAISAATRYLAEGEILQLIHNGDLELTEQKYFEIIFRKTGALITACCQIGAYLGGVNDEKRRALERFGKNIGMAFQLTDDMLDFTSDRKTLGKPAGQDLVEGHITLPFIHAYKNASPHEREFFKETLKDDESTLRRIDDITGFVEKNGGVEYARRLALRYVEEAKSELEEHFSPGIHLDALKGLAEYVINRAM
ncbi:MAG: octaprenyl diphosphate synthase [bacterium]|nr:MAG: octaprenyl diphosphate synthase [bacterium]